MRPTGLRPGGDGEPGTFLPSIEVALRSVRIALVPRRIRVRCNPPTISNFSSAQCEEQT